jgi:hypothetical protein
MTRPITTPATNTNTATTAAAAATADDCNKQAKHWNAMFEKLKAYKEVYGNCTVPLRFVCDDGSKLGNWVQTQRRMSRIIKDSALLELRRRELNDIGFVWVFNERNRQLSPAAGGVYASREERFNARWTVMFGKLKEYQQVHDEPTAPTGSRLDWFCLASKSATAKPKVRSAME